MKLAIGLALGAAGLVLLIFGISASNSVGSDISNFFTGKPTDKAVWLMAGGCAALVAGIVVTAVSARKAA